MTIILTNDDSINAPGIAALRAATRNLSEPAIVVAPQTPLSGCGHQVTTHSPIPVEKRSATEYAVGGMPADCTRLALYQLCPEVTWVLSGINAGGNMGVDRYISGTIAAVREATFHGIPGIAISQYRNRQKSIDWQRATQWTADILVKLMQSPPEPYSFWNVNLPHLEPEQPEPEVVFCEPSNEPLPLNYRMEGDRFHYVGDYQQRQRTPGTDVEVCFSGNIAVTKVRLC
ncbi:MAG: 5'/3'-nucleotidase SurE [Cyanobacteriota bacterium]|nr:5'/3'-nucleotidase SurE [Cyanobacteriota bacterium]